jgi:aconitate hydratase
MLIPRVVGFKLSGELPVGTTATDMALTITEMLRKHGVVGKFVEFFGPGLAGLTLEDEATIANMAPEYGATAAMFFIDDKTLDYLRLTGREDAQVKLVETYAKTAGLWADSLSTAQYERTLHFDLGTVVRNMAGPSNPHKRLPTSDLAARGIAAPWTETPGEMPDGAVIIAAITSCTNTSNPRNVIAAGLLARNANARGLVRKPWVKTSLAPGSKAVQLYLEEAGLLTELEQLGFGIVAFIVLYCKKVAAGQSWGQKTAGVRVIDINSRTNLTPGRVFLRQLSKIISGFLCYLGFFWMLWDPKQQTWHDKIVGTAVVDA